MTVTRNSPLAEIQRVSGEMVDRNVYCNVGALIPQYDPESDFWQYFEEAFDDVAEEGECYDCGDETRIVGDCCRICTETFEYWAVSDWLRYKLREQSEIVVDVGMGLYVWCRGTTGQAIKLDACIEAIALENQPS
jgi:hypothetical protein